MITQESRTAAASLPFDLKKRSRRTNRVLVVDDNDDVRQLIAKALELIGCEVIEAHHGLEGYELFRRHGADLVVTDIDMPVMNGYGLIEKLRGITPHTPIVVVTGNPLQDDPAFLDVRVKAVLCKPFSLKRLQQVAKAALGRQMALLA